MITLRKIENGFEIEFTGEHIPPPNNHLRISPKKITPLKALPSAAMASTVA